MMEGMMRTTMMMMVKVKKDSGKDAGAWVRKRLMGEMSTGAAAA